MELQKQFLNQTHTIITNARNKAIRSVNTKRVLMYWQIGKVIFEEEQQEKNRAIYGSFLIKLLAEELKPPGSGFSKRQINRQLFERLLLSNDIKDVLAVAQEDKIPENPIEIIKDPMVLEFLGLKRESNFYEKDLETAILNHLQEFILELGNGFSFVARQKRIHLDDDEYFVDLVFYNRLLNCFVIIEIKTKKITHQDIGQLQMYVNYYDRFEKQENENPTIGILLCTDKNNTMVKITLPKDNKTIIASKYQLYLPTEKQLIDEVLKEVKRLNLHRD